VTGGAGYIGSHACAALLDAKEEIILLDNFSNAKPDIIRRIREIAGKDFPCYELDLLDEEGLRRVFRERQIESVMHFAGLKAVGESVGQPLRYYYNNVTGTLNLCKVMGLSGCKTLVFSSSATVYGMSENVPFAESAPLRAINPYGMTKLMIEQILQDVHASDPGWSILSLRYFNPLGAHPSGLLGEDPKGIPNNLLPYIARVAAGRLQALSVFGDDYNTPDGTGVRDYLHVSDLVDGHIKALAYLRGKTGADAVNLGSGKGHSAMEVLRAFERACGKPIPYKIAPRREGDIAVCYADPEKARRLLGWEARRSLAEMCASAWNFMLVNPDGIS
jgi:UDP-glucose 4-epimerase